MHIPDGYLSPQTYIPFYAVFLSFLATAVRKIKKTLTSRMVPYLGMSAAFSFLIMMFNFPVPGGSSGHAVGSALISLVFGPWIAIVSVSIALIIQAFVFGDGGITAIGANCFNMAIAMPFIAWACFRLIRGNSTSLKRINIAAFLSAYLSLCLAAVLTAIEIGIQPLIASSAQGVPLYAPYPLKIAIPAMAVEHLILFGLVEGIITALIFKYFYHHDKEIIAVLKV